MSGPERMPACGVVQNDSSPGVLANGPGNRRLQNLTTPLRQNRNPGTSVSPTISPQSNIQGIVPRQHGNSARCQCEFWKMISIISLYVRWQLPDQTAQQRVTKPQRCGVKSAPQQTVTHAGRRRQRSVPALTATRLADDARHRQRKR